VIYPGRSERTRRLGHVYNHIYNSGNHRTSVSTHFIRLPSDRVIRITHARTHALTHAHDVRRYIGWKKNTSVREPILLGDDDNRLDETDKKLYSVKGY
jgi:hypothetical protein